MEEWTGPQNQAVPPNEAFDPELTCFIFHGYGADCEDLRSLAAALKTGKKTHWIFPNGPLSVPIGPGWHGSAWWNIDFSRFERPDDFSWTQEEPKDLSRLREEILTWIQKTEPDWNKVILGGFSQGSMLALDLFLHAPQTPHGLLLFSSALINKANWSAKAALRAQSGPVPRFFQSHGTADGILPVKVASQLETLLTQSGWKGSLMQFPGSHEIPRNVIDKANQYLQSLNS